MPTTLTSKGQVTIPKEIRDQLGLKPGDKVEFTLHNDGILQVVPRRGSIRDLKGILPKPKVSLSLEELDDAIARAVIDRARR